jgi:hypothetical protein
MEVITYSEPYRGVVPKEIVKRVTAYRLAVHTRAHQCIQAVKAQIDDHNVIRPLLALIIPPARTGQDVMMSKHDPGLFQVMQRIGKVVQFLALLIFLLIILTQFSADNAF